jgi:hypothetical protein
MPAQAGIHWIDTCFRRYNEINQSVQINWKLKSQATPGSLIVGLNQFSRGETSCRRQEQQYDRRYILWAYL